MSDPELVCTREEHVLVARLNRPERRNALSVALLNQIGAAATEAETSDEIRVLLLTGTGTEAFCAGMDLREFAAGGGAQPVDESAMAAYLRLMNGQLRVPVVAAVNAAAVGGGLELLLGCDVIVAAETATFGLPEVKRGLFAGGSGTTLGTRIPLAVALEMGLTGDVIDAGRAHALGLVNRVVAGGELMAVALDLARRIAGNGPLGVAATKELMRGAVLDGERLAARADALRAQVFGSEDAREGAQAFVERRDPVWQGR